MPLGRPGMRCAAAGYIAALWTVLQGCCMQSYSTRAVVSNAPQCESCPHALHTPNRLRGCRWELAPRQLANPCWAGGHARASQQRRWEAAGYALMAPSSPPCQGMGISAQINCVCLSFLCSSALLAAALVRTPPACCIQGRSRGRSRSRACMYGTLQGTCTSCSQWVKMY